MASQVNATENVQQATERRLRQAKKLVQAAIRFSTWMVGGEEYLDERGNFITGFSYTDDRDLLARAMARLVMTSEGAGA